LLKLYVSLEPLKVSRLSATLNRNCLYMIAAFY
jgi:hypothetical protein